MLSVAVVHLSLHVELPALRRRERELASKIRAPAEAEKYKLEILAQANRVKSVAEVRSIICITQVQ